MLYSISCLLYESRRFWRTPVAPYIFLDNGLLDTTNLKQPIQYFRGHSHVLSFLKLFVSQFNGVLVREGTSALKYQIYFAQEHLLISFLKNSLFLQQLPIFLFTDICFLTFKWRIAAAQNYLQKNSFFTGSSVVDTQKEFLMSVNNVTSMFAILGCTPLFILFLLLTNRRV